MGANRAMFARLLVLIGERLKPAFTIIDGILALEGEGPGKRGKPRQLGVLIGGDDALAVDTVVCRMFGLEPDSLPTLKAAREMSLINEAVEIEGTVPSISDFQIPSLSPLIYGPELLHGFIRRHLLQRPVCDGELCQMCGKCWEFCPAAAIGYAPIGYSYGKIGFDYERCIRCYCCIEVCPVGALHAREPFVGRIVRRIIRT
jgi:ferredoxin